MPECSVVAVATETATPASSSTSVASSSTSVTTETASSAPTTTAMVGPKFKTNNTAMVAEANVAVNAKLSLVSVGYQCDAHVKGSEGVRYVCGSPYRIPNVQLEAMAYVKVEASIAANLLDASFCGCVANQLITGQNFKLDNKVEGRAGYTVLKPSEDNNEVVVDEEVKADKPRPGAGPGSAPGLPSPPAAVSKADCVPKAAKVGTDVSVSGSGAHVETHASVAGNGVHVEAHSAVTIAIQGGNKIYVPAASVHNGQVVPAGAPAALPSTVPVRPAPAAGPAGPARAGSPPAGSSPAGVRPVASAGLFPARPAGTGAPIVPSAPKVAPPADVLSGAAAMTVPALALAAGILVAAF
ncbi:hypothetical protein CDD80_5003 [Ophiocordyceps camponoti-rufipedis]|uniref:Uncharacterized protein n=1 Tax=Ophiocordyceps camponoti-rufipedis TaxID=2004952 RepID=A0A2C5YVK6_9HYPO|nr:hypothetical protein CDD80_5003 [Ophiocordyceps camponoti-rufipedis]